MNFTVTEGPDFDPAECHYIVFTVGSTFADPQQCHYGGSDTTAWYYRPAFASCVSYDAGTLDDGAFPEAGADGLFVVPESGTSREPLGGRRAGWYRRYRLRCDRASGGVCRAC